MKSLVSETDLTCLPLSGLLRQCKGQRCLKIAVKTGVFITFRLDGVSSRFQETSAEFEQARNKARKAKIEFETVKKNRLALQL